MAAKWRVLLLDTKRENPNHYIAIAIAKALAANTDVDCLVKADYGNAIQRARENACNLFFAFDGEEIEPALCERLSAVCGRSIAWYVEDPYEIRLNKRNAALFDLVFTNDVSSVQEYGSKGRHLPLAACPDLHFYPVGEQAYRYDLFFAGTAWPNRIKQLKAIEKGMSGIRLKLALPSNEHLPAFNIGRPISSYSWRTTNREFARFANRSAVVLLLHRQFTTSGGRAESATPGPRLFEVALAGGFQLVDRRIPGIGDYLREETDYAAFSSPEECLEKLKFYLDNERERLNMARSAQETVLKEHTYAQRIDTILTQLEDIGADRQRIEPGGERRKRRILMVCHNLISGGQYGGVEIYLELCRQYLARDFELLYYLPDRRARDGKRYLLLDGELREIERFELPEAFPVSGSYILSCPLRERVFATLLYQHNIDLVHWQHLIGHVPSLPYIAKAMGVATVFTMHDYYAISHRFNLLDSRGSYEVATFRSLRNADRCLNEAEGVVPGSQARRVAFWGRMLSSLDLIHVNSETTRQELLATYPHLDNSKIMLSGIPLDERQQTENVAAAPFSEGPLQVLVLGNFTGVKGADTLLRVFEQTKGMDMSFHVYGRIDPEYQAFTDRLDSGHVTIHQEYENRELESILRGKHVSLHLSLWPETYCITLSECWRARLVPVVSDIGALAERVAHGFNGFKTGVADTGAVIDILQRLSVDRDYLQEIKSNITSELYMSSEEHFRVLSNRYHKLVDEHSLPVQTQPYDTVTLDMRHCGVRLNSNYWAEIADRPLVNTLATHTVRGRIPRHPYYLLRFMVQQVRSRGIRVTAEKVFKTLKNRI